MTDNVSFNQETAQDQPAATDKISFTVGERKYDADSAATKIENQDSFIEQLKQENQVMVDRLAELEKKMDQATNLDQAIEKLQATSNLQPNEEPQLDIGGLKAELLSSVDETLNQREQKAQQEALAATQQSNLNDVIAAVQGKFGRENADSAVDKIAGEYGMNRQQIAELAMSNPVAAKRILGLHTQAAPTQAAPASSINSTAQTPEQSNGISWDELRNNPSKRTEAFAKVIQEYQDTGKHSQLAQKWSR